MRGGGFRGLCTVAVPPTRLPLPRRPPRPRVGATLGGEESGVGMELVSLSNAKGERGETSRVACFSGENSLPPGVVVRAVSRSAFGSSSTGGSSFRFGVPFGFKATSPPRRDVLALTSVAGGGASILVSFVPDGAESAHFTAG